MTSIMVYYYYHIRSETNAMYTYPLLSLNIVPLSLQATSTHQSSPPSYQYKIAPPFLHNNNKWTTLPEPNEMQ